MSNASDSTTTTSTSSRFNRGFFIRIVAVAMFLGLGTLAVSQSLKSKSTDGHDHDHDHPHDTELVLDKEKDSDKQNAFVIAASKNDSSSSAPKNEITATPRLNEFKLPKAEPAEPKTADLRPSVVPREKNLVAKPAVIKQDNSAGQFSLNPRSNPLQDTAQNAANELKENVVNLGNSIAEKSNELLANSSQSLTDLSLPKREPTTQNSSEQNPFRVEPESFAPRQNTTQNQTQTFPKDPAQSTAGFDQNRNLAPLRTENPSNNLGQAKSGFDNPIARANSRQSTPEPTNRRQFNDNFSVQSQQPTGPTQQSAQSQTQIPNANQTFATPPANLRNNPTQQPRQFQPANTPAQGIPTMNASTTRPIPAPAGGIRTLPTPGEKELEGTRTPTLTIQRVAPREIQLNTPAQFEFIVRNVGNIAANNVRIDDRIPTGTQLLESSPQPTQNVGGAVQWNIGTIAPGQERRIKMKLNPTQPGEIGSVAQVSFGTFSSVRTLVTKPELEITHSAPAKSLIGDRVPLDIVVTNKGNGPATRVIIQEDIPNQLEYSDGFRQIEYEIGTLAPGQSRKLQLTLKAANIGALRNVISANADGGLTSQHAINMEIVAPKLTARSNGPRRRYLRREATHQFEVQNNGTAAATNVELMAKLAPGLKYVSSNNRGQYDAATNAVYWSLAELDPSVAATVELTTVPVSTGDQPINFTAVADLKQKATTDAPLIVEHLVDVFFDIDDVIDHIEIGSETKYQVRVVNQGTKTATNIRLVLDLAPGIRPKDVEGSLQSQIQGQRVIFAPITSMNPGDEIKVAINATGTAAGEHKVVASMQTDGRQTSIQKEETTQVYADR